MDNDQDFSNNYIIIIIIIIIIILRREFGMDTPVSVSSNSFFKGLPSRRCPFRLPYFGIIFDNLLLFVANLIFIFLVSRQPIPLSTLSAFLHSFCGQKGGTRFFF